ncbi:hypothetical protein KVC88_05030 [Helicobacter pylori]|nr:hypothetical protein KVC88_05030 [Helicobacter pylori]
MFLGQIEIDDYKKFKERAESLLAPNDKNKDTNPLNLDGTSPKRNN